MTISGMEWMAIVLPFIIIVQPLFNGLVLAACNRWLSGFVRFDPPFRQSYAASLWAFMVMFIVAFFSGAICEKVFNTQYAWLCSVGSVLFWLAAYLPYVVWFFRYNSAQITNMQRVWVSLGLPILCLLVFVGFVGLILLSIFVLKFLYAH